MPQRTDDLSEQQKACLRLVHQGFVSKQIASQLSLTPGTVDNYINAALGKLSLTSRREAARLLASEESEAAASIVQQLHLQSSHLAERTEPPERPEQASDRRPTNSWSLSLPPIGGDENELTKLQRLLGISRIGFAAALLLIATVVVIQGVITLLI